MDIEKRKFFKEELRKTFIAYALLPTLFFSLFFYNILIIYNREMIKIKNNKNNKEISQILQNEFLNYKEEIEKIKKNIKIKEVLKGSKNKVEIYEELYGFVNKMRIKSVFYIINKKENIIITNAWKKGAFNDYEMTKVLKTLKINTNETLLMSNRNKKNILGRTIKNEKDEIIGYVVFELSETEINNIINENEVDFVAITDNFKNVIATTNEFMVNEIGKIRVNEEKNRYNKIKGEKFYIYKNKIDYKGIEIYTLTSMKDIDKFYLIGLMFMLGIFIFLILLFWFIARKVSKNQSKSVDELLYAIKKVQEGKLDTFVDIKTNDEFEIIGDYYNEMIIKLNQVIKKNKEQLERNKNVEIKQLESQFNPHFLFNTLEILKYMIKMDEQKAIKIIISMANLLRYSIDCKKEKIRLINDIEYIKDYMIIQKIRFDKKFDYEIEMGKEVENCRVPKLILQPLIENAVKYGFGENKYLKIKLKCYFKDKNLILKICNTGKFLSDDKLKEVNELLGKVDNKTNHLGVYNVQRRIKLMYGKEYGLTIKNQEEEGVEVKIKLPIIIEKKG